VFLGRFRSRKRRALDDLQTAVGPDRRHGLVIDRTRDRPHQVARWKIARSSFCYRNSRRDRDPTGNSAASRQLPADNAHLFASWPTILSAAIGASGMPVLDLTANGKLRWDATGVLVSTVLFPDDPKLRAGFEARWRAENKARIPAGARLLRQSTHDPA